LAPPPGKVQQQQPDYNQRQPQVKGVANPVGQVARQPDNSGKPQQGRKRHKKAGQVQGKHSPVQGVAAQPFAVEAGWLVPAWPQGRPRGQQKTRLPLLLPLVGDGKGDNQNKGQQAADDMGNQRRLRGVPVEAARYQVVIEAGSQGQAKGKGKGRQQ